MNPPVSSFGPPQQQTRRQLFADCGLGVGKIALASLLANTVRNQTAVADQSATRKPHFPPKVKRVVYLFMSGAPSQLDLFDEKPLLKKHDGQPIPPEVVKDQRYAFIQRNASLLASRFRFQRHGQSGANLSEAVPHLASIADRIAIIKSVTTDQFNHAPAQLFMNTGSSLPGRPAMGSWLSYGLGSAAKNLPSFVVLNSGGNLSGGAALWGSGFLPTSHQGVPFRSQGDPILNVSNPPGVDAKLQRDSLDLMQQLNRQRWQQVQDPEILTQIHAYELAHKMQTSAPELMDLSTETKSTLDAYGVQPGKPSFAQNCLLARRLLERGVRFVQLYHGGWDHHSNVEGGVKGQCRQTDQPAAALVKDLEQRGLLKDTLVVWGGEFGRTPMVESNAALGRKLGRDHHPQAFSMWMAGGGVKPGMTLGETDDLGFHITKDRVHVHDLQATILHLLGLAHERLTFHHQGRDFRLTDVHGHVVEKLLA